MNPESQPSATPITAIADQYGMAMAIVIQACRVHFGTASIHDFSFGVSDRGASIRIPIGAVEKGWKGWLEDRRPNSAADPYKVAARIIKTVKTAKV